MPGIKSHDLSPRIGDILDVTDQCRHCKKYSLEMPIPFHMGGRGAIYKKDVYVRQRQPLPDWLNENSLATSPLWCRRMDHDNIMKNALRFDEASGLNLAATWVKYYYCRPELDFYEVTISAGFLPRFNNCISRHTEWTYVLPFYCMCDRQREDRLPSYDPLTLHHQHLVVVTRCGQVFSEAIYGFCNVLSEDVLAVPSSRGAVNYAFPPQTLLDVRSITTTCDFIATICNLSTDRSVCHYWGGSQFLPPDCQNMQVFHFSIAHPMVPHAIVHLLSMIPGGGSIYLRYLDFHRATDHCYEAGTCFPCVDPMSRFVLDASVTDAFIHGYDATGKPNSETTTYVVNEL